MSHQMLYLIVGSFLALLLFGALFVRERRDGSSRSGLGLSGRRLWEGGLLWMLSFPGLWLLLLYGFLGHIWLVMGRWPRFGETLPTGLLRRHHELIWWVGGSMTASLGVAALVMLVSLCFSRWRHFSVFAAVYVAAVGLGVFLMYLTPGPFLNWFLD